MDWGSSVMEWDGIEYFLVMDNAYESSLTANSPGHIADLLNQLCKPLGQ